MSQTSIAILSDIHGNPHALAAVLADIDALGVDEILIGGDLVGRGPRGSAVVDVVRSAGWPCIKGNHEDYLLNFRRKNVPDAWLVTDEWSASRFMAAELTDADIDYIDALPFSLPGGAPRPFRLVHGSPRSNNEGLGPWTSDTDLNDHLATIDEDVLVCAHTHRPMVRQLGAKMVVNIGSVGLPFNGDWRAQYAVLSRKHDAAPWEVLLRQVEYDRDALLTDYTRTGFLSEGGITAHMLRREVLTARPALVPFLAWARTVRREPEIGAVGDFDAVYDPAKSTASFFMYLGTLNPA